MATSDFTFTVSGPCGCCGPAECCLCLSANICINVTNPDWATWVCPKYSPPFSSDSEFQTSAPFYNSIGTCSGGVNQLEYRYDSPIPPGAGSTVFNTTVSVVFFCDVDGTCTCGVSLIARCYIGGISSPSTFTVTYQSSFTISLTTPSGETCSVIDTTTASIAAVSSTGPIPVPFGSLSPVSITLTNGACPVSAPLPQPQLRMSLINPPCKFLSEDPITAGETARIGLPTIRQWKQCAKGHGAQGTDGNGYICGCMPWPKGGCNGCPDYVAADVI